MAKNLILAFVCMIAIIGIFMAIGLQDEKEKTYESIAYNKNKKKVAYLTFDDGPSKNTIDVLKVLDKYKIKATFFVVGSLIDEKGRDILKQVYNKGHSIGIHTYSHKYNQIYVSKKAYIEDFNKAKEVIKDTLGITPCIYRFPGGSCNCYIACIKKEIIDELGTMGYSYFDWNVSAQDAINRPSVYSITKNVIKDYKAYDRPIVLLHDGPGNKNTVYALPTIIENMISEGYSFGVLK